MAIILCLAMHSHIHPHIHARRFSPFSPFLANPAKNGLTAVHLQRGDEGRLWDLHVADLAHALLALLLLFEKLLLAADVAAVALRQHVLAQRADRLARDHAAAD